MWSVANLINSSLSPLNCFTLSSATLNLFPPSSTASRTSERVREWEYLRFVVSWKLGDRHCQQFLNRTVAATFVTHGQCLACSHTKFNQLPAGKTQEKGLVGVSESSRFYL
eukprot:sb/3477141/